MGSVGYKVTEKDKDYHEYKPAPKGHRYEKSFNDEILHSYWDTVTQAFIKSFCPDIRLFLRYEPLLSRSHPDQSLLKQVEDGIFGIFTTNSEPWHRDDRYELFRQYCLRAKAIGYSEAFSDAEGNHGGEQNKFAIWPSAWNYWRLLGDLDCGFSYLAIYGADLACDKDPEFHEAFEFAAKYAGNQVNPAKAPGAWVAFRAGDDSMPNLSFLMNEKGHLGSLEKNVGSTNQRFGAWARKIQKGEMLRLQLNADFAKSVEGTPVRIRVVYLNQNNDSFIIRWNCGGKINSQQILCQESDRGQWKETVIDVSSAEFGRTSEGGDISVSTESSSTLHIIEIERTN
jgi:hypothetical protein